VDTIVVLLRIINLLFGAVVLGALIMEMVVILPGVAGLSPGEAIRVLRRFAPIAWGYLPVCGTLSTLTAIVIVVIRHALSTPMLLTVAGTLLAIAAVVVGVRLYLPVDQRIRGWPPEAVPAEYAALSRRLATLHTVRTILFTLGYAAFVVAGVAR
jgi:hypothetical protein